MKKLFVIIILAGGMGISASFAQTTSGTSTDVETEVTTDTLNGVEIDAYRTEPVVVEGEAPDSVEIRESTIPEDADHVEIMDSLQNTNKEGTTTPPTKSEKRKNKKK